MMNTNLELEENKLNKLNWLCPNCIYSGKCTTERISVGPVFYCEEHFVEARKDVPITNKTIKPIPFESNNLIGLCASCSVSEHCSLRSEERIIFNCEHYH